MRSINRIQVYTKLNDWPYAKQNKYRHYEGGIFEKISGGNDGITKDFFSIPRYEESCEAGKLSSKSRRFLVSRNKKQDDLEPLYTNPSMVGRNDRSNPLLQYKNEDCHATQ